MYPISYEADYQGEGRNRLTTFFRPLLAIPWWIVAGLYGLVAQICAFIAWFAIVFTGRYPEGLYNFNAGYLRMASRTNGFAALLTDEYPSFGGDDDPAYPVRVGISAPLEEYSRMKTLFRLIIGIPVMILGWVMSLILNVVSLVSWFAILFTGRLSDGLFNPMRSASQYLTRAGSYFLLMTEDWPPFTFDEGAGAGAPAGAIERETTKR